MKIVAPKVIDLFCGIGGASLGFKQAGYKILLGLDIDKTALEIYKENVKCKTIKEDIRKYTPEKCLTDANIKKGELDVLVCCPPCQGFSKIRKDGETDKRNDLVFTTARFIIEIKPKLVVFENVPGILAPKFREKFNEFCNMLKSNDYLISDNLENYKLNAANYGIPQRRKRVIMIAIRKEFADEPFTLLKQTHFKPKNSEKNEFQIWKTVKDAFFGLKNLRIKKKDPNDKYHYAPNHTTMIRKRLRRIPKDGGSREDLPKRFQLECHQNFGGHKDVYGRMEWNKPAPTLTGGWHTPSKGRFTHPVANRGLTIREACRLQTFPDDFDFLIENRQKISLFLGNAVPVEWIRIIANQIAKEMNWVERLNSDDNINFWERISK
ncbi:MAG: DNA cytosine methyltransferase [Candidatus Heimdallarchaeota archaeon]|nr:DNA cytosine methyltransferase [Candidatus Heimdallarchaeota archaeon]